MTATKILLMAKQGSHRFKTNGSKLLKKSAMHSLIECKTWTLSPLPPGRKAIGSRWIFKIKRHEDGTIEKFKTRFVAQGFSQVFGSDYDELLRLVAIDTLSHLRIATAGTQRYISSNRKRSA